MGLVTLPLSTGESTPRGLVRDTLLSAASDSPPFDRPEQRPEWLNELGLPEQGLAVGLARQTSPGESNDAGSPEHALAAILSYVISELEARALAHELMATFGTLGAVLACKAERLTQVCHNNLACVSILRSALAFVKVLLREPAEHRPVIKNIALLFDYLRISLAHEQSEQMRILHLNCKNALLKDELHCRGTFNHVPVYPREVIKSVLEVGAGAVILVHNHPSGDPNPSQDDIDMTRRLATVLNQISVKLHDHIIVGRSRCESMRELGLL